MTQPRYLPARQISSWVSSGALLSVVITVLVFSIVWKNGFVDLDDIGYIQDNRYIDSLNWNTIYWAFTSYHEANWHPLTMLSLALDRQLWGTSAIGFHATNIFIHSGTTFMVYFVFRDLLERVSRNVSSGHATWISNVGSLVATLFFSIHPLRVESVVWASERKDVLSLFFIVAAVCWHLKYVKASLAAQPVRGQRQRLAYWMVLVMASCALMSKPTAVSLPFVLLIVDWFPLARIVNRETLIAAAKEKVPLFLLSFGAAVLTVRAQQYAITQAPDVDLVSRVFVACKALPFYLWKMLLPTDLAPYYPHPGRVIPKQLLMYLPYAVIDFLAVVAAVTLIKKRRLLFPALLLFYIVVLVPMLGLIQVGGQWIADRYTYFPALGISLFWGGCVAWLSGKFWYGGRKIAAIVIVVFTVCQLSAYSAMTWQQIKVWRSTETLASREIALFPLLSGAAYFSRSKYRKESGRCDAALEDIEKALAIALRGNLKNKYAELSMARAEIFICLGRADDALSAVEWAYQTGSPDQLTEIEEIRRKLLENSQRIVIEH